LGDLFDDWGPRTTATGSESHQSVFAPLDAILGSAELNIFAIVIPMATGVSLIVFGILMETRV
jgi:hypothetical protein